MVSALSDSQSAVLSLTSLFPSEISMPSEAVVPLVITMQLFFIPSQQHTSLQVTGLDCSHRCQPFRGRYGSCQAHTVMGDTVQSGCTPVTILTQFSQAKVIKNDSFS